MDFIWVMLIYKAKRVEGVAFRSKSGDFASRRASHRRAPAFDSSR
jgi:hypothetical protein